MKIRLSSISTLLITLGAFILSACGEPLQPTASSTTPGADLVQDSPSITEKPVLQARIVGGSSVTTNKYPWMAAIKRRNLSASAGQFCGGSLIADKWILTAAHCVIRAPADAISVVLGRPSLDGSGGETINVTRIIAHPGYRTRGYPDLALLELSGRSSAKPIQLPTRNNSVAAADEFANVIGWGQLSETRRSRSNQLRQANVPIVSHQKCRTAYRGVAGIVEDAMICAGTPSGDKDSCYGDSGGPLFVSRGQEYVQAGVVSFGKGCGLANVPGVYARVSSYHDWISGYANVSTYRGQSEDSSETGSVQSPAPIASIDSSCEALSCSLTANNLGSGNYYWNFGDGGGYVNRGTEVRHVYNTAGEYTVYLIFVAQNGNYQQLRKQIKVFTEDENNTSKTVVVPLFTGRLQGRGSYVNLPRNGVPIILPAGNLNANLTVPSDQLFALYVHRYDSAANRWNLVSRLLSTRGSAVVDLPINAGEYAFTVQSWNNGGDFRLNARVN